MDSNLIISVGSTIVSGFLSLIISAIYYHKANRDAFYSDILLPIAESDDDNLLEIIKNKKMLYSYRYAKKKEKKFIDSFEEAKKAYDRNTREKAFSEAIWQYFFEYCKNDEEIPIEPYEFHTEECDISQYAKYYYDSDEDDIKNIQSELKSELQYYAEVNKISRKLDGLFEDKNISEIVDNSQEYKKMCECRQKYYDIKNQMKEKVKHIIPR